MSEFYAPVLSNDAIPQTRANAKRRQTSWQKGVGLVGVLALSVLLSQDACGTTGPGHPLETATISDTPFYSKPNLRYICFVAIDEPATHITLVDEHDGFVAFDVASTGKPGLPPTDSACAKADDHSEVWVPKTALSDIQPGG